jgi:hypothetical protein
MGIYNITKSAAKMTWNLVRQSNAYRAKSRDTSVFGLNSLCKNHPYLRWDIADNILNWDLTAKQVKHMSIELIEACADRSKRSISVHTFSLGSFMTGTSKASTTHAIVLYSLFNNRHSGILLSLDNTFQEMWKKNPEHYNGIFQQLREWKVPETYLRDLALNPIKLNLPPTAVDKVMGKA